MSSTHSQDSQNTPPEPMSQREIVRNQRSSSLTIMYPTNDIIAGFKPGIKLMEKRWTEHRSGRVMYQESGSAEAFHKVCAVWGRVPDHPNVVPLKGHETQIYQHIYGVKRSTLWPCAFMPLYKNGNIRDFLAEKSPSFMTRLSLIRDVACGLAHLHGCNPPVVHGRLLPRNILVTDEGTAVLSDYGLGDFYVTWPEKGDVISCAQNDVEWTAPEIMDEQDGIFESEAGDIFAFASLAHLILTNERPCFIVTVNSEVANPIIAKQMKAASQRKKNLWQRIDAITYGGKPDWRNEQGDLLTDAPERLLKWIDARWDADPSKRGSMRDLLQELDAIIEAITQGRNLEGQYSRL